MRIEIEIPKEFEKDYTGDKFKEFFSRVLCDIDNKGMCGNYEKETAEMFIKAFDESKSAYNTDKIMKQYHEDGELWQYTIEHNYRCDCGCNVFHKEYNKARNKIQYICNSCEGTVGELKDEYLQKHLSVGVWK